jgi:outer membrane murein-binding lipoprotein Lpp
MVSQVSSLKSQVSSLKSQVSSLKSQVSSLKSQASLKSTLSAIYEHPLAAPEDRKIENSLTLHLAMPA